MEVKKPNQTHEKFITYDIIIYIQVFGVDYTPIVSSNTLL